ncbi:MAG: hypothetical protein CAF45_015725 [Nitrospira sp. CG24E]|nr:MAG: hypothetical protein CAF45_015725 [Nitrospira sp. CG24E]
MRRCCPRCCLNLNLPRPAYPTPHFILPTSHSLLPTPHSLLTTYNSLLTTHDFLIPTALPSRRTTGMRTYSLYRSPAA